MDDIKKFQSAMRAASDSPSGDDLSVLDLRLDKREGSGKQAEGKETRPGRADRICARVHEMSHVDR
jgi:hypothetical protein